MKISSLFLSLCSALAVAPAFGKSVALYAAAPNRGGLSRDCGIIASCSCCGGYRQNSAVNGKYYGDLIGQGDFELLGSEGGGHYATGAFLLFTWAWAQSGALCRMPISTPVRMCLRLRSTVR